jgi:hypothetical protein
MAYKNRGCRKGLLDLRVFVMVLLLKNRKGLCLEKVVCFRARSFNVIIKSGWWPFAVSLPRIFTLGNPVLNKGSLHVK